MPRSTALLLVLALACGCSREGGAPAPTATRHPASVVASPTVAVTAATPLDVETPVPAESGTEEEPLENLEDLLEDKPSGPDFEIDAAASSYYAPIPNTVTFKAKALNGSPPFTFTWKFGDGSPETTGETVRHTYDQIGTYHAFVTGEDANKAHSTVEFILLMVTPQRFVETMHLDPKLLEKGRSPGTSPTPAAPPSSSDAAVSASRSPAP